MAELPANHTSFYVSNVLTLLLCLFLILPKSRNVFWEFCANENAKVAAVLISALYAIGTAGLILMCWSAASQTEYDSPNPVHYFVSAMAGAFPFILILIKVLSSLMKKSPPRISNLALIVAGCPAAVLGIGLLLMLAQSELFFINMILLSMVVPPELLFQVPLKLLPLIELTFLFLFGVVFQLKHATDWNPTQYLPGEEEII